MYNELTITTPNQRKKAFFMNGFHSAGLPTSNLHKHNFSEIHLVAKGGGTFSVGDETYHLDSGNIMIIPKGIFHGCSECLQGTLHTAFQIDYDTDRVRICHVGNSIISDFFAEIEMAKSSRNYGVIASYISLFCNKLCLDESVSTSDVTDYGFIISEFLSLHYNENIRLCDLAGVLHLSERQTERLVKEQMGRSFKEELCAIRMNIAKQLSENSDMTLYETARYVGYDSYAGFWKASKRMEKLGN